MSTSVCKSGKNGKPRHGGGDLEYRKRSSSLLFGCSWHSLSAEHSIFNLATALVITSNSSSNKTDCGGKLTASSRSTLALPSSSEEDNTSTEPSFRTKETVSERASVPKEWALDLAGKKEKRTCPSPIFLPDPSVILMIKGAALPLQKAGPEPRCKLMRAPSSTSALREWSVRIERWIQCGQSTPQ